MSRRVALAVLLLTLLGVAACGDDESAPQGNSATDTIYGAVLSYIHGDLLPKDGVPRDRVNLFLIQQESEIDGMDAQDWDATWKLREDDLKDLRPDTCAAFVEANARSGSLAGLVQYSTPIQLVPYQEFLALTEQSDANDEWTAFFRRYPGAQGYLSLSLPGVSKDGLQALVYLDNVRGGLEGWSGYCLLKRDGAAWAVTAWALVEIY